MQYTVPMNSKHAAVPTQPQQSSGAVIVSIVTWLLVAMLAALAIAALKAPAAVPATAAASDFSAERALAHLKVIAQTPHPIGSQANDAVRDYLVAQLSSLGMNPQIFSSTGLDAGIRFLAIGRTQDVIGRLPGTANSKAIMLVAHYDSVYRAPGAGDDGAGVAAILEAVRALRAGPALKNDLIVLFTDGEEAGLLGADAFASSHPWMKDVGLLMNFEGRGDQGPSLLFETSNNNRPLIEAVSKAAPYPAGSSLFYAFYKRLPNDTDFTVFRPAQLPGLNFAFGANLEAYHSRLDNLEDLSTASLQHHGSYAVALTRHFGEMDLASLPKNAGDDIFFDWFGSSLISYSEHWVLPLQLLATVLLILTVLLSLRAKEISAGRWLFALLPCLALLLVIPLVLIGAHWVLSSIISGHAIVADSSPNAFLLAGLALLGAAGGSLMFAGFRLRFSIQELSFAGLTIVCLLNWVVALKLPAGSYLLFWPLFFTVLGLLAIQMAGKGAHPRAQWRAGALGSIIAILLFAPVAYLLYVFLTFQPITAAATGLLVGLFFITCAPTVGRAVPQLSWRPAAVALLVCALISMGAGIALSHYTPMHPRHDTVLYSLNADNHSALWISYDHAPDEWTSQFLTAKATPQPLPDYLGGSQRPALSAPAPILDLAAPVAELKADQKQGDIRNVELLVRSPRNARVIYLNFPHEVRPQSVKINGREAALHPSPGNYSISIVGMSSADLQLSVKAGSGLTFWLLDQSSDLPAKANPRPANIMAGEGSDTTLVVRKYSF
jgi:hypothetical protein